MAKLASKIGSIALVAIVVFAPGAAAEPPLGMTAGGMQYRDLREGAGNPVAVGDLVRIHVALFLDEDGQRGPQLCNSRAERDAVPFVVGSPHMTPALNEGVVGMRPGGKRLLLAPPAFAWGRTGVDSVVPADASVILIVIWCRSRRPSSADGVPAAAARPRLDERLGNRTSTPTAARRVAEVPRAGACDG